KKCIRALASAPPFCLIQTHAVQIELIGFVDKFKRSRIRRRSVEVEYHFCIDRFKKLIARSAAANLLLKLRTLPDALQAKSVFLAQLSFTKQIANTLQGGEDAFVVAGR